MSDYLIARSGSLKLSFSGRTKKYLEPRTKCSLNNLIRFSSSIVPSIEVNFFGVPNVDTPK